MLLGKGIFASTGIRLRASLIFSAGLFLLIGATVFVTYQISDSVARDDALLTALTRLRAEWLVYPAPADLANSARALLNSRVDDLTVAESLERLANAAQVASPPRGDAEITRAFDDVTRAIQLRRENSEGMVRGMFAALFLSTLAFLMIGLWFTQQTIVAPVESLDRIARRIAQGDFDTAVALDGQGEFRELARSFETMRVNLHHSREQTNRFTRELEAHVTQRTQQLAALSQVIAAASRSLELETAARTALEQSLQVIGVEMGGLWLMDEATGDLHLTVSRGMSERMQREVHILRGEDSVTGRAAMTGQIIALEDINLVPHMVHSVAIHDGVRSVVAVPIKVRERVLGVLDMLTRTTRTFTPEEIALLTSIGQQIGIAVDSLRLMYQVREQTQRVASLQERERIGVELHDGLLQTLGYLYLKMDVLEAQSSSRGMPEIAEQLAAQRTVLDRAAQDLRQSIANLHDLPAPPLALQTALSEMADEFMRESAMSVTLQTGAEPFWLAADKTVHLVRIAREALSNAERHGRARHATITFQTRDGRGELWIADDGAGFDPGIAPTDGRKHFGLSVMKARAASLGGNLRVESAPTRGARVCVEWQLQEENSHASDGR
ncbi:MAG: GAF domain-containing protein [Chloroflexi bacterium]|nr:GAF domain-containing protein [Chloroflexota bacterium]